MLTDLIYSKDKYEELFKSVIDLLEDGSLMPTPELKEFVHIVEIARSKANSAIIRAIRKSNMKAAKKAQLERLHKKD